MLQQLKLLLESKENFENERQDVLDRVPQEDILGVLGGFNARVGKREECEEGCTRNTWDWKL